MVESPAEVVFALQIVLLHVGEDQRLPGVQQLVLGHASVRAKNTRRQPAQ